MLHRLQSLFNRLAGVCDHSTPWPAEIEPSCPHPSFTALERPACWRRRSRKLALTPRFR